MNNSNYNKMMAKEEYYKKELSLIISSSNLAATCLNCDHFNESSELCTFNDFNQRPPARIIVKSCDNWCEVIPF